MLRTLLLAAFLSFSLQPQGPGPERQATAEERALIAQLAEHKLVLDPVRGWFAVPVDVLVRDDLLEYLLVGPAGAAHESAFMTPVAPSVLNVAMLALGVTPGTNANWKPKDQQPSEVELREGASPYEIALPSGEGFFLYVGWKRDGETYFFRVEDVLRNLSTGQAMKRHTWVYLGSRMVPNGRDKQAAEVFAAEVYQNLINVAFFRDGYTLLTGALPDCVNQGIWMLNAWLVPERGARVEMFFSRHKFEGLPPELESLLPTVEAAPEEPRDR
ncbi:MAG: hypothetical protein IT454_11210 [Planctomycetes bacterium]|nr:hypothetical protein [Planctomycetota bacterium]